MEEEMNNKSIEDLLRSIGNDETTNYNPLNTATPQRGGVPGLDDFNKYDRGLRLGLDQNDYRAKNQSNRKAVLNIIPQTLTTIIGDTVSGFGYLAEALDGVDNLADDSHNLLVQLGEAISEGGRELAPIYVQNKNQGFQPLSTEWWASNAPSIGSAVSLLIPARAVSGAVGAAGKAAAIGQKGLKALKTGSKIDKSRALIARARQLGIDPKILAGKNPLFQAMPSVGEAFVSRHMENMMEATGTFDSTYQEALAQGMSEEEAKRAAGEAAKANYKNGYLALMTDIPQYMALAGFKFPKIKASKSAIINKGRDVVNQMISEGFEENLQFAISEHSKKQALDPDYESSIAKEMYDSALDPEALTSTVFGAIGGGVFGLMGSTKDALEADKPEREAAKNLAKKALTDDSVAGTMKDMENADEIPEDNKKTIKKTNEVIDEVKQVAEDTGISIEEQLRMTDQLMLNFFIENDQREIDKFKAQTNDPDAFERALYMAKVRYLESLDQTPEVKALLKKYDGYEKSRQELLEGGSTSATYASPASTIALRQLQNELELQKTLTDEKQTTERKATSTQESGTDQGQQKTSTQEETQTEGGIEQDEAKREADLVEQLKEQKAQYEKTDKRIDQLKTQEELTNAKTKLEEALKQQQTTGRNTLPGTTMLEESQIQDLLKKVNDKLGNKESNTAKKLEDLKNNLRKEMEDFAAKEGLIPYESVTPEQFAEILDNNPEYIKAKADSLKMTEADLRQSQIDAYTQAYEKNQQKAEAEDTAKKEITESTSIEVGDTVQLNTPTGGNTWVVTAFNDNGTVAIERDTTGMEKGARRKFSRVSLDNITFVSRPEQKKAKIEFDEESGIGTYESPFVQVMIAKPLMGKTFDVTISVSDPESETGYTQDESLGKSFSTQEKAVAYAERQIKNIESRTEEVDELPFTSEVEEKDDVSDNLPIDNDPTSSKEQAENDNEEIYQGDLEPADLVQSPEGVFYKKVNGVLYLSNVTKEQKLELNIMHGEGGLRTPETNTWKPLHTKDGETVMSDIPLDVDYDALNKMELQSGVTPVEFYVDPNDDFNSNEQTDQEINENNFRVYVRINGVNVGVLKSYAADRFYKDGDELLALRKKLWKEYKNNQTSYISNYKTVVSRQYTPWFKKTIRKVLNAAAGVKLYVGKPGGFLKAGNTEKKFKNATPGAVYKEVQYNGKTYYVRVFTKNLDKNGDTISVSKIESLFPIFARGYKESGRSLEDMNYYDILSNLLGLSTENAEYFTTNYKDLLREAQSIVFAKNPNGRFAMDFNADLANRKTYHTNNKFDPAKYIEARVKNLPLQVKASKLNVGDYNEMIADRIIDDLHEDVFHSRRVGINLSEVKQTQSPTSETADKVRRSGLYRRDTSKKESFLKRMVERLDKLRLAKTMDSLIEKLIASGTSVEDIAAELVSRGYYIGDGNAFAWGTRDYIEERVNGNAPTLTEIFTGSQEEVTVPETTEDTEQGGFSLDIDPDFMNEESDEVLRISNPNSNFSTALEEVAEFRKFLKFFPVKVLEEIYTKGGKEAWGRFTASVVEFAKNNGKGTGRHEAMHVIFELGLTAKQQDIIFKEYEKKTGVKDRMALREIISDEFMDYYDANISTGLGSRIRRFFRRIANWIRITFNMPMTSKQVFQAAEAGLFRNIKPNENYKIDNKYSELFRIPPMFATAEELYERVDDAIFQFFRVAKDQYTAYLKYTYPDKSEEEINKMTSNNIDNINFLLRQGNNPNNQGFGKESPFTKSYVAALKGRMNNKAYANVDKKSVESYIEALESGAIQPYIYRQLMSYGIMPTSKSAYLMYGVSEENLPTDFEEQSNDRESWQTRVGEYSGKESLSQRLKTKLAFIKRKEDGKFIRNAVGGFKFYPMDEVYNTLLRDLGNSTSTEDMLRRFRENVNIKDIKMPVLSMIQDKIDGDSFVTDLYTSIGQYINPRYTTIVGLGGMYQPKSSDRFTLKNAILNSLKEVKKPELLANLDKLTFNQLKHKLHKNGLMFPDKVIDKLANDTGEQRDLALGKIEYFSINYNYSSNSTALTEMVNAVLPFYPKEFQSAFYSVHGERVYSWIKPSYMGRFINKVINGEITKSQYANNPLLKNSRLLNSNNMEFVVLDGIKHYGRQEGNQYSDMSPKELMLTQISAGLNNIFFAPVLSDSPSLAGIQFQTGQGKFDVSLATLTSTIEKEIEARERYASYLAEIEAKIKENKEFQTPEMYRVLKEMKSYSKRFDKMLMFPGATKGQAASYAQNLVEREVNRLYDSYVEVGMITETKKGLSTIYSNAKGEKAIKEEIRGFVINDVTFRTELTLLMIGDPAQYKNPEDFYKRSKQIWSPGTFLDTTNLDTQTYNVEYLESEIKGIGKDRVKSENYDAIAKMLKDSPRKDEIMAFYEEVDVTDAQSLIDPFSYMQRLKGLNRLDPYTEKALDLMMRGKSVYTTTEYKGEELQKIQDAAQKIQPLKPFYFAHHDINTGDAENGFSHEASIQNKDSEFMMMPAYADPANKEFYNPEYKKFMERMGYTFSGSGDTFTVSFNRKGRLEGAYTDKFTYDSALKVGLYGVGDGTRHQFYYENWRLQVETPEHHINSKTLFGTQIAKLFTADLREEDRGLVDEYDRLMKNDIDRDAAKFRERFYNEDGSFNYELFVDLLKEEVIERGLGEQYLDALEIVNGETKLPLWFPIHANRIEPMIYSMYRNNITKRYFKNNGVTLINASVKGYDKKLKIKKNEKGQTTYEVLVPPFNKMFWQKKFLRNGYPSADLIRMHNPELLEGIVYRIPTEDKYSMFNIEVVGFLPQGGAIVMPEEVTAIAGLDFDVDKVFGFFKSSENLEDQASYEIREVLRKYRPQLDKLFKEQKATVNQTKEYFASINAREDSLSKLSKDYSRLTNEINNLTTRNELLNKSVNRLEKILSNPDTLEALLRTGDTYESINNEKNKVLEQININSGLIEDYQTLLESIKENQADLKLSDLEKEMKSDILTESQEEYNRIQNEINALVAERDAELLPLQEKELEQVRSDNRKIEIMQEILGKYDEQTFKAGSFDRMKAYNRKIRFLRQKPKKQDNSKYEWEEFSKLDEDVQERILSEGANLSYNLPSDQIQVMNRMNMGKALIGVGANNNVSHSMITKGNVKLKTPFTIGENTYNNVSEQNDKEDKRITENISETMAAFVDNGKDPQAEYFNFNTYTASVGYFLLHSGIPLENMMAFIRQPILKELSDEYFNNGKRHDEAVQTILEKYAIVRSEVPDGSKLTMERLEKNIASNAIDDSVLDMYLYLKDTYADRLADLVRVLKDGDVGLGPNQFVSFSVLNRRTQYLRVTGEAETLIGSKDLLNNSHYMNYLYKVGMQDAYVEINENLDYPTLQRGHFASVMEVVRKYSKKDKLSDTDMKLIYDEYLKYIATNSELYKNDKDTMERMKKQVPAMVERLQIKYPDNKFLSRLETRTIENVSGSDTTIVEFMGTIGADKGEIDRIRNSFLDLLIKEEDAAFDLVRYAFLKDGFSMSMGGFGAYIPIEVFTDTKVGKEFLEQFKKDVLSMEKDTAVSKHFFAQFASNVFPKVSWIKHFSKEEAENKNKPFDAETDPLFRKYIRRTDEGSVVQLYMGNGEQYVPVKKSGLWDGTRQIFSDYSYFQRSEMTENKEIKFNDKPKKDNTQYQLVEDQEEGLIYENNTEMDDFDYVAYENTIRDISERMAKRIGIKVVYDNNPNLPYKGKIKGNTAYINLAYATLDTPIHEILGHPIIRGIKNSNKALFNKLTKELETGYGKKVLDRVKERYDYKRKVDPNRLEMGSFKYNGVQYVMDADDEGVYHFAGNDMISKEDYMEAYNMYLDTKSIIFTKDINDPYTLEEQQEEAIVQLLGEYTANKIVESENKGLIKVIKDLLREMRLYIRSLFNRKELPIELLDEKTTIDELANLLAYRNSKIILPETRLVYITPDNQKFKVYEEASSHLSDLANLPEIDIDDFGFQEEKNITINDIPEEGFGYIDGEIEVHIYQIETSKGKEWVKYAQGPFDSYMKTINKESVVRLYKLHKTNSARLYRFVEKNKEFERIGEAIKKWKNENNIVYNPEEAYSRGQGFYSAMQAYSSFDLELMLQNLIGHIEDLNKAGGKFIISAYNAPVGQVLNHLEKTVKFEIYPESQDIEWAASDDVYSGSVWEAPEVFNPGAGSEVTGVSFSKYPSLRKLKHVEASIADSINKIKRGHNELGISLNGNNFRLSSSEKASSEVKDLVKKVNDILDEKYGPINKPKIDTTRSNPVPAKTSTTNVSSLLNIEKNLDFIKSNLYTIEDLPDTFISTSIDGHEVEITKRSNSNSWKALIIDTGQEAYITNSMALKAYNSKMGNIKPKEEREKKYTKQKTINAKVVALKNATRKYPRSLIRTKLRVDELKNAQYPSGLQLVSLDDYLRVNGDKVYKQLGNITLNKYVQVQKELGLSEERILENLKVCKGL